MNCTHWLPMILMFSSFHMSTLFDCTLNENFKIILKFLTIIQPPFDGERISLFHTIDLSFALFLFSLLKLTSIFFADDSGVYKYPSFVGLAVVFNRELLAFWLGGMKFVVKETMACHPPLFSWRNNYIPIVFHHHNLCRDSSSLHDLLYP